MILSPCSPGELRERIHFGETHSQMHRQHRLGARRDGLARRFHVQAISVGIDVGEHWHAAREQDRGGGAVPGVSRHDDFIAKPNAGGLQRGHQRDRSIGQAQPVLRAVQFGKTLRELAAVAAGHGISAPVAAFHHLLHTLGVGREILRPD